MDDLKNIPEKYRPIPFWSWNEKLDTEETKRQIEIMKNVGLGGYIMHARGGLQTVYMGDEWFENISIGIDEAEKLGLKAWIYDENGWPSGFGSGKINELGEEYQQKFLCIEEGEKQTEYTICNIDGFHIYYKVDPFYVDNLDKKVVKRFIDTIYAPYYEKYGSTMEGFFTDEPQLYQFGIPWSLCLEEEYEKEYGEKLTSVLIQLFKPVGAYKETRKKFYRLIAKLFSENYCGQIYRWCDERNIKFTGHLVNEESMSYQTPSSGSCMASYEYFHIPGMDWLGREIGDSITQHQVVSAALQTGKKQILSETFGLCGHNVSFSELRQIYEWQMVRGVNLLCQHLQGYSLRGIRKRDYPPAMYYQQPWWAEYKIFVDAMSRIGMLVAEGEPDCDTLLIHPMTSAWMCYDGDKCEKLSEYETKFKEIIADLEAKHIQFHLGDEILMERHGRVKGNKLIIGEMEYTTIVLPPHIDFLDNTKRLLDEFKNNGGEIVTINEISGNPVTDNTEITYLKRVFKDFDMHYFVNSTKIYQNAKINVSGVKLDIVTGEEMSFNNEYIFAPYDSLVVLEYKNSKNEKYCEKKLDALELDGEWEITECSENALLLDTCDCYFEGELIGKGMSVSEIQNLACKLEKEVQIKCVFYAEIDEIVENLCLVSETPEIFRYRINGKEIAFDDEGYFRDISFRKMKISEYLKTGQNVIELYCDFKQSEKTYADIRNAVEFESVRNKLTYDMEIENIYLVGDFSIKTSGEFEMLDKDAVRYTEEFCIDKPVKTVKLHNIEQQGFPFFSGRMSVRKTFDISDVNKKLVLNMKGINAVKIQINKKEISTVIWNNSEIDISPYLSMGENVVELTFVNNLRNLLGPHHLQEGEDYMVLPSSFIKGENFWNWTPGKLTDWHDGYCFVETSIK